MLSLANTEGKQVGALIAIDVSRTPFKDVRNLETTVGAFLLGPAVRQRVVALRVEVLRRQMVECVRALAIQLLELSIKSKARDRLSVLLKADADLGATELDAQSMPDALFLRANEGFAAFLHYAHDSVRELGLSVPHPNILVAVVIPGLVV